MEGRALVEEAEVGGALAEIQESFRPDAPVDDDADDAVTGERSAVAGCEPWTSNLPPMIQTITGRRWHPDLAFRC